MAFKKYRENVDEIKEVSDEDKISIRDPTIKLLQKKNRRTTRLTHTVDESAYLDMSGSNSQYSYRDSNLLDSMATFKNSRICRGLRRSPSKVVSRLAAHKKARKADDLHEPPVKGTRCGDPAAPFASQNGFQWRIAGL